MARDLKSGIYGVFVLAENTTKANIEHWENEIKALHGTPDQYGNTKAIEFEEGIDEEDGSRYINFWVE